MGGEREAAAWGPRVQRGHRAGEAAGPSLSVRHLALGWRQGARSPLSRPCDGPLATPGREWEQGRSPGKGEAPSPLGKRSRSLRCSLALSLPLCPDGSGCSTSPCADEVYPRPAGGRRQSTAAHPPGDRGGQAGGFPVARAGPGPHPRANGRPYAGPGLCLLGGHGKSTVGLRGQLALDDFHAWDVGEAQRPRRPRGSEHVYEIIQGDKKRRGEAGREVRDAGRVDSSCIAQHWPQHCLQPQGSWDARLPLHAPPAVDGGRGSWLLGPLAPLSPPPPRESEPRTQEGRVKRHRAPSITRGCTGLTPASAQLSLPLSQD